MLEQPFLRLLDRIYSPLIKLGTNLQSLFLFIMRLIWGHNLLVLGTDKILHFEETIKFFTDIQITQPQFLAYEISLLESVCGALFIIGLASRLAAIPIIVLMSIALSSPDSDYMKTFGFLTNPQSFTSQEPYPYLLLGLIMLIFGPGRISFDAWIKRWVMTQPRF